MSPAPSVSNEAARRSVHVIIILVTCCGQHAQHSQPSDQPSLLQPVSELEVASEYHLSLSLSILSLSQDLLTCLFSGRHSNVEVEQLQKNAASMTSRIRHLEHALAVSQAQLASNAQSGGYSLGRSGPLESGFKPAALNNVFNPAACSSSSVSLHC